MKREIKFRAWDNSDKEMKEVIKLHSDYAIVPMKRFPFTMEIYDCVVMQYTGLKDKNGKEIYEGDLLDFGNRNPAKVIFDNGCFNVFDEPLGWDFDSEEKPIKTDFLFCEIIGNIHETPELLKTK